MFRPFIFLTVSFKRQFLTFFTSWDFHTVFMQRTRVFFGFTNQNRLENKLRRKQAQIDFSTVMFKIRLYNLSESVVAGVRELSSQSQLLSLLRTQDMKDTSQVEGNTGQFINRNCIFFALEEHTKIAYLDEVKIRY